MKKYFMKDACYKHATMLVNEKRSSLKWVLRCNFCNKFLSVSKITQNRHRCYHCEKDLEYH